MATILRYYRCVMSWINVVNEIYLLEEFLEDACVVGKAVHVTRFQGVICTLPNTAIYDI